MTANLTTDCCIAGGGPAGMMLGYMLARTGLRVVVLEKHADFFRDFRGDTVHPSTLEAMSELGLLERFLQRPHDQIDQLSALIGETVVKVADFRHLPAHAKFIAMMPQWDFLDFLREEGSRYSGGYRPRQRPRHRRQGSSTGRPVRGRRHGGGGLRRAQFDPA
jgi:2-polyprenyl-6-methoxyphenol hydroxylase-like FAD-dependent oxidoreductase